MPGIIASNRAAVLLFTVLMFALALAATVMLAKHGVTHTGALAAHPNFVYNG